MKRLPLLCTALLCILIFAWNANYRVVRAKTWDVESARAGGGRSTRNVEPVEHWSLAAPAISIPRIHAAPADPSAPELLVAETLAQGRRERVDAERVRGASGGAREPRAVEPGRDVSPERRAGRGEGERGSEDGAREQPGVVQRVIERFPNGDVRLEGERVDGRREGRWVEYWEGGVARSEGRYVADQRADEWTFWHDNGQVRSVGSFEAGLRNGDWRGYDREGRQRTESVYRRGRPNGYEREWFSNGQVRAEGTWRNGKREGEWRFYDFQGRLDGRSGMYVGGHKER